MKKKCRSREESKEQTVTTEGLGRAGLSLLTVTPVGSLKQTVHCKYCRKSLGHREWGITAMTDFSSLIVTILVSSLFS